MYGVNGRDFSAINIATFDFFQGKTAELSLTRHLIYTFIDRSIAPTEQDMTSAELTVQHAILPLQRLSCA